MTECTLNALAFFFICFFYARTRFLCVFFHTPDLFFNSTSRDVRQGCNLCTHAFKIMRILKRTWTAKQKCLTKEKESLCRHAQTDPLTECSHLRVGKLKRSHSYFQVLDAGRRQNNKKSLYVSVCWFVDFALQSGNYNLVMGLYALQLTKGIAHTNIRSSIHSFRSVRHIYMYSLWRTNDKCAYPKFDQLNTNQVTFC